jgi:membrane-bound inhibitor of C-type lysozyme
MNGSQMPKRSSLRSEPPSRAAPDSASCAAWSGPGLRRRAQPSLGRDVQYSGYPAMAVLVLLVACALERPPGVVRVTYDCDQGRGFVARYERDGQVVLELSEGERLLSEVAAIDGSRYDDGTYELRLHGRTATLQGTASTYSNCAVRDWQESEPR